MNLIISVSVFRQCVSQLMDIQLSDTMIKLTEHNKGLKMEGFLSLNTAPSCNDFCTKMSTNKDCICSQCYGKYMERRYPRAKRSWIDNFNALTSELLPYEVLNPVADIVNRKRKLAGFRIHSVGEFFNDIHVKNIFKFIGKIQVDIPVTLWTKRLNLLDNYSNGSDEYLHKMCNIIHSNPIINTFINPSTDPDYVLHTFNVYDNELKMKADMAFVTVSMGIKCRECSGKCKDCMICYPMQGEYQERMAIFELTKKAQGKTR